MSFSDQDGDAVIMRIRTRSVLVPAANEVGAFFV